MSYKDRIKEMIYTSSVSGVSYTLKYEDLSRTGGRKAPISEFPGQDQGAVQDLGSTTPTFPVSCFIDGENYDQTADSFWAALHETGPGVLSHPRWGELDVLPVPNSQSESFVSGMGQANFDITFIKVDPDFFAYPNSQPDGPSLVSESADSAVSSIIDNTPESLSVAEKTKTKLTVGLIVDSVSERFSAIAGLADDVRASIDEQTSSIQNNIDALVEAPQTLQTQMTDLMRTISEEEININNKIEALKNIYNDVILNYNENLTNFMQSIGFLAAGTIAAVVTAAAEATQYGEFKNRNEAVEVITYFFNFKNTVKGGFQTIIDGGGTIPYNITQAVDKVNSDALYYLSSQSFNLSLEKKYILPADLTTIETVYNLYGDTERLDEFIEYNNLTGDQVIVLPRGKEVLYYA